MYYIIEIQTYSDHTEGELLTKKATQPEAESEFYRVMSAAAISDLPRHACTVLANNGATIKQGCYDRPQYFNEVEE